MEKRPVYFSFLLQLLIMIIVLTDFSVSASAQDELTGFDLQAQTWAEECRTELLDVFEQLVASKKLNKFQLFDTFYIPIPDTYPPKYHTQYDRIFDQTIQTIIDRYQSKDNNIVFAIAVDRNGYVPTHNTIYSKPLTGDREQDSVNNRTKRIFNDRTGLKAAHNKNPYLLQSYSRDTGKELFDLSIPIFFQGDHWGAVRIGYRK